MRSLALLTTSHALEIFQQASVCSNVVKFLISPSSVLLGFIILHGRSNPKSTRKGEGLKSEVLLATPRGLGKNVYVCPLSMRYTEVLYVCGMVRVTVSLTSKQ